MGICSSVPTIEPYEKSDTWDEIFLKNKRYHFISFDTCKINTVPISGSIEMNLVYRFLTFLIKTGDPAFPIIYMNNGEIEEMAVNTYWDAYFARKVVMSADIVIKKVQTKAYACLKDENGRLQFELKFSVDGGNEICLIFD